MLELAILGLLKDRPMHGYDLRRRLREDFGALANLSFGSLYPALARLEASGAVEAVAGESTTRRERRSAGSADPAVPLTGSLGGELAALAVRRAGAKAAAALAVRGTRARKVYEITARGEELFEELLGASDGASEDPRSFTLRLAFARHLSPAARVRLLERRRIQLADRLQRSTRSLARPERDLDVYERSLAEHLQATLANDLAWVEGLLTTELAAAASTPAGGPDLPRSQTPPARDGSALAAPAARNR